MISLPKYVKLSKEEQEYEIQHVANMLEISYNVYDDIKLQSFRGQIWKLEKYLILYLYLQK